jgi:hypothetical protein
VKLANQDFAFESWLAPMGVTGVLSGFDSLHPLHQTLEQSGRLKVSNQPS